jgi:hypothetical protein
VLDRFVSGDGRVDFDGLVSDRADLDVYVEFVAEIAPWSHPDLFPTEADRLAYHINSYNALAMSGILDDGVPDNLGGVIKRLRFFKKKKFAIGGREMSLHAYENEVIREFGEPRIHFAINCMSGSCPRLRRELFRGDRLEQQLEAAAREFFNQDRHLRVEPERERAYVSEILKWFKEDFVSQRVASSILEYANRYRTEPIPDDYSVTFIPYDWTVIAQ